MTILIILIVIVLLFVAIKCTYIYKYKIKSSNGIQESLYVEIRGIKQYIQVQGQDEQNPVILFLHGGPGFPIGYLSHMYQPLLTEEYTFVNWDQRNSGRTYYQNRAATNSEINIDTMLKDVDEIVNYLLRRFKQDKIIIMGQSWGTVLGIQYVSMNPDKVEAYIGVGQVIDFDRGKIVAANEAIEIMKNEYNQQTKELNTLENAVKIFQGTKNIKDIDVENLETMILSSLKYLKGDKEISGINLMLNGVLSPTSNLRDIQWFLVANNTKKIFKLQEPLLQYMYYDFNIDDFDTDFQVPIYFISGGNDWITPYVMVEEYFKSINAPDKKMVIIEETGHTPFFDQPRAFAEAVKEVLLNNR